MQKIGKVHTYVYYRKRQAAWMFFLPFLLAGVFAWSLRRDVLYDTWYKKVGIRRYEIVARRHVPFVFPSSLYRIPVIDLSFLLFFGFLALVFLRTLLHRGPVYIITSEGIMDCKRGFVPWHQIEVITLHEIDPKKSIFIALKDPIGHFGGKWRSFYGYRGISLAPSLMWYQDVFVPDEAADRLGR